MSKLHSIDHNDFFLNGDRKVLFPVILIISLTFLSFLSILDNNFVLWDDKVFITNNELIKDLSWDNLWIIFTSFYKEFFSQPLVLLSFSLEFYFFQLDPFFYHLDNLILHIFNTILVFSLILMLSKRISISFIAAILFGVHPLHVESVAWIAERKDVLSTFFFLQAIILYMAYKKKSQPIFYYVSLFLFILALFCKAMAVTLPVVLLLCDYLDSRAFDKRAFMEKVPFFLISFMFGIATLLLHQPAMNVKYALAPVSYILISIWSIFFYLSKIIIPVNLSAYYPYPEAVNALSTEYLLPPFLLIALIAVVFYSRKWTREIIFGSLFFLVTILPVLKLIPVGDTFAADRYMYIPSIGLFYIAGVIFNWVYARNMVYQKSVRISLILLLSAIVISFSMLTYFRNDVWQDSETLWLDVVEKYPHSTIAHNNLSSVYEEMGLLNKAISEAKAALKLDPDNPFSHYGLGIIYAKKGMVDDAIVEYNKALRIKPDFVQVRNNLGLIYREKGLFDEAIGEYGKALKIAPQSYYLINNLGVAYLEKGLLDEAVSEFRKALAINPDYVSAHNNLGSAYV